MSDSTPRGYHQTEAEGPAIGQDEWVARHAERRLPGRLGDVEDRLRRVPWWVWLVLFVGLFCLFPIVETSGYVRRVAFDTVLLARYLKEPMRQPRYRAGRPHTAFVGNIALAPDLIKTRLAELRL